jgi:hypothetical protein
MKFEEKYYFRNISLFRVRNRNELRVIDHFESVLDEYPHYSPNPFDIKDIYALALNSLAPHYAQEATVILKNQANEGEIKKAIRKAVEKVRHRPISLAIEDME